MLKIHLFGTFRVWRDGVAECYARLGHYEKSIAACKRALAASPVLWGILNKPAKDTAARC